MIVCSHCQFENPQDNKFCQQCGSPLKVWRVLLTDIQALPLERKVDQEHLSPSQTAAGEGETVPPFNLTEGTFLDPQKRYRLLQDVTISSPGMMEARVVDTQPDQPSPLLEQYDLAPLQSGLKQTDQDYTGTAEEQAVMIPEAAYPYLALQEYFFPSVPELQDAWMTENYSLLLIEDRLSLTRLLEAWGQSSMDPLQQVHGFYTMVELWDKLVPFNGQASLLRLDNLCLDEDQIFCLRQIDRSLTETSHTLQDLGLLWQSLLQVMPQPPGLLVDLAHQVTAKELTSVDDLKQALVAIADQIQTQSDPDPWQEPVSAVSKPTLAATEKTSLDEMDALISAPILDEEAFEVSESVESEDFDDEAEDESTDLATMVLPMKLIGLDESGQTHVGQQRDHNEDAYFIQSALKKQDGIQGQKLEAQALYVLCDGMGGHAGGEIASKLAVETLQTYFTQHWQTDLPSETQLQEAIGQANQVIYERNLQEERSGNARMGTTLLLLLINNTQAVVAHVGDSRLYRYTRRLGLQQITVDHEVGQREIQRGIEPAIAYARPDAYQLTQALGPRDQSELNPGISYLNFTEDTLLILCSDGLSDHDLLETHCQSHLEPMLKGPKSIEEGITDLIDLANEVNGHDNITAVAVKLKVKPNLEKMAY
jgi:protein phosphatase